MQKPKEDVRASLLSTRGPACRCLPALLAWCRQVVGDLDPARVRANVPRHLGSVRSPVAWPEREGAWLGPADWTAVCLRRIVPPPPSHQSLVLDPSSLAPASMPSDLRQRVLQGNAVSSTGSDSVETALAAAQAQLDALGSAPLPGFGSDLSADGDEAQEEDALAPLHPCGLPPLRSRIASHRVPVEQDPAWAALPADDCFDQALEVDLTYPLPRPASFPVRPGAANAPEQGADGKAATFRVYYTPPATSDPDPPAATATATATATPLAAAGASTSAAPTPADPELAALAPPHVSDDDDTPSPPPPPTRVTTDTVHPSAGASVAAAANTNGPPTIYVLFHGAGYSALSFALLARAITRLTSGTAGVLTYDCRGHGRTRHPDWPVPLNMDIDTLALDALAVLAKVLPTTPIRLVLVGHSMGGAVATAVSGALLPAGGPSKGAMPHAQLTGVTVLDVVEGTAIDALPAMRAMVAAFPRGFASVPAAIQWHVASGTLHNRDSARRSVPPLIRSNPHFVPTLVPEEEEEAMEDLDEADDDEEPNTKPDLAEQDTSHAYVWSHNLAATEPFWRSWFEGLSTAFLGARCARLLILAGADRLDKHLLLGQMQGKFQLLVFPDVGHVLHEDAPERTARTLVDFTTRNQQAVIARHVPTGPPRHGAHAPILGRIHP